MTTEATAQTETPAPNPERLFQALTAYQTTAAIKAAIELDIFTAIAEGADTPAAIAASRNVSERGARILSDFLTVAQFLNKQDGRYRLSADAAIFLDRRSPAYLGAIAEFLAGPHIVDAFQGLTASVRKGGTAMPEQGSMTPEHPMWEDFARAMVALMTPFAGMIADILGVAGSGPIKVLDIAAGHGMFGIEIARRNPEAQVFAVDWQNVLPFARANAAAAGVAERFHEIPGDAFKVDYGSGYDIVLITNFFHHFDKPTCVALMRKIHAALRDNGRAVTFEFVPDEDRVTPPTPASFALIMLGTTPAGDAYTFSEFDKMFRDAGFSRSESHPTPPQHVIVSHK